MKEVPVLALQLKSIRFRDPVAVRLEGAFRTVAAGVSVGVSVGVAVGLEGVGSALAIDVSDESEAGSLLQLINSEL